MSGESVDALFARFQTIVNEMRANRVRLHYDDHERAIKLLHALDRNVREVKVATITESPNYETLTVEELFSKLKSTEIYYNTRAKIENPSAPTMALVSGNGSSSSFTNPSQPLFALSSLLSITEEQMEVLGDDELALVISWFSRFHNNCLNRYRGGSNQGCFGCGDPDHFVTNCPKKSKYPSNKYDSSKRKEKREHSSDKHKSKGGFDKEALKKRFLKKTKAQQHAFLASLSDLDDSSDERASLSSSDDELERKVEDRLNGLCFYTMTLGDEETSKDEAIIDDDTPKVLPCANKLVAEVDALSDALLSQDRLFKPAARERKEYKDKLEQALKDLEIAKPSVTMTEETECDTCAIHMSSLVTFAKQVWHSIRCA